uniref:Uncharacterized protein n=1 Tax=Opuntia streptacantha TaxID=393608 RepID=A0A7C9D9F3_OPUST
MGISMHYIGRKGYVLGWGAMCLWGFLALLEPGFAGLDACLLPFTRVWLIRIESKESMWKMINARVLGLIFAALFATPCCLYACVLIYFSYRVEELAWFEEEVS